MLQNVRTILTTIRGSVPLDREFGIDGTLIDQPTPVARAKLTGEIVAALNQYEPRVKVVKVTFTEDGDGRLIPSIRVRIDE
ncbi:GPW/gp25 family protein [Acetomicrobium sp. S15 = DSM 107314]|uniref:GPW/gp25 family protein n=1 Tax=Acetomicrobium sp. S15 = DSM 107314 TaxID=2529858 RepID=UPI0031586B49